MNNDENVPAKIPTSNANTNPRMVSPPKMKMASNTTNVEPDVLIERSNVLLTPSFILSYQRLFG